MANLRVVSVDNQSNLANVLHTNAALLHIGPFALKPGEPGDIQAPEVVVDACIAAISRTMPAEGSQCQ